jgi:hypothetical protein
MFFGLIASIAIIINPIMIGHVTFDVHTLLYTSAFVLIGFQFIAFYGLTKVFAVTQNLLPKSNRYNNLFKLINLEKGLVLGAFLTLFGIGLSIYGLTIWSGYNFGALEVKKTLRIIIPSVTIIIIGIQIVLYSFFFSILGLKDEKN